ncbi:protein 5NUC-like [Dermacentor andersoni]|uniref:protein 5NUC-like n=1 Tax=Dermacentor andersoni TaxID=34620 RepID=UPI0021554C44|nr:protein 5NUC-like [Dermacentor andersoni]XP_054933081.1 protein 5NUC-like [Dermacentor andersoni]XP_054933082.1 protein 5NUC-like [Dermacentor andersoni]
MAHHSIYDVRRTRVFILMSIIWCWCHALAQDKELNLTILHTNDIHAHLEESNKYGGECFDKKGPNSTCVGGVARIVTKVKEIRQNVRNALFMNAGDFFQGTPYYTIFKESVISAVMSKMGYNYACLGNHEFDDGPENLARFLQKMKEAGVTIVGTNTDFSKEPLLSGNELENHAIIDIDGTKIGILGAVIPSTQYTSSPGPNVEFYDEADSFKKEASKLVSEGVNIIIAITHSGFQQEIEIVDKVPEIDVLVGGHTNTFLYTGDDHPKENTPEGPYPYVVNRTDGSRALVVQDFWFGKFLGRLDVTFNSTGHVVEWGGNPILLNAAVNEDPCMTEVIQPYKENLTREMGQVIGRTKVLMEHEDDICRLKECNIGNLVADAYYDYYVKRETTKPPAWSALSGAVVNAGSIRTALPSFHNVTRGDVLTTLPYGNSLVTVTLTGTDIWNMFEHSVTNYTTEKNKHKGRFLQVSGFRVTFDLTKPNYSRVTSISVLCANCSVPHYEPLNLSATYGIVTADFLTRGGDGFEFDKSVTISDGGPIEYEALEEYVTKISPIRTPNEDRIKITWNSSDEEQVRNYTKTTRESQICDGAVCTNE